MIKSLYQQFYTSLLTQGKLPTKDTALGFWGPTSFEDLNKIFANLQLKNKTFLDLGSGDGKVTLFAASNGAIATGIEIDQDLHNKAQEIKKHSILKATFLNQNYLTHNLQKYNVIYIYPDNPFSQQLQTKLQHELCGLLICFGNLYLPTNLTLLKTIDLHHTKVRIYEQNES